MSPGYRVRDVAVPRAFLHAPGRPRAELVPLFFPETLDLAHDALMERFRRVPLVVVSPHFDDACFSLGGFVAAVGHGTLVNVFTRGRYLPRAPGPVPPAEAFAVRDAEDAAFAARCGLSRLDLACEEPALRERGVHDLAWLEDDIGQMAVALRRSLDALAAASPARAALFVPLGAGRHCNHRAVAELVLRHLRLLAVAYDIFFYEDLPYAAAPVERFKALLRVGRRLNTGFCARYVFSPSWPQKRDLVALYPSQLRRAPRPHRFRPAALSPWGAHEAFWTFPLAAREA